MPDELVTVAAYPQPLAAHAARNYLADNGIQAFVADEFFSTLNYATLSAIKLQVSAADAERAREILASVREE